MLRSKDKETYSKKSTGAKDANESKAKGSELSGGYSVEETCYLLANLPVDGVQLGLRNWHGTLENMYADEPDLCEDGKLKK